MTLPVREGRSAHQETADSSRPTGLVHGPQELLNMTRKAENRLHRVQAAKTKAVAQWEKYQFRLKETWMKVHAKYNRNAEQLDRDIQEALSEQTKAFQAVRQAWLDGGVAMPDEFMGTRAEAEWDQLRNIWEQEDAALLQSVLHRAVTPTAQAQTQPGAGRQLRLELLQLPSYFGAQAPGTGSFGPPGLASEPPGMPAGGPPAMTNAPAQHGPPAVIPDGAAHTGAPSVAVSPATPSKGGTDMQVSPAHPGQCNLCLGRVPTTVEPPRQGVKPATMAPVPTEKLQGPLLATKPEKKRDEMRSQALRPFGAPVPTSAASDQAVHVHINDGDTDEEMNAADKPDNVHSPGLGRMG